MKKAHNCDGCQNASLPPHQFKCSKGHKPRFYQPRRDYDDDWGWKRRCDDYAPVRNKVTHCLTPRFLLGQNVTVPIEGTDLESQHAGVLSAYLGGDCETDIWYRVRDIHGCEFDFPESDLLAD